MVSSFLEGLIEMLEPELRVHRLWEVEDRKAYLRKFGRSIRVVATDSFSGLGGDVMADLPSLELIANFGAGYDTIDADYAAARGVAITNTPDVLNDDVADLAIALMLAVSRRIVAADRFVREGQWNKGPFPLATKLSGKRLGIVGLGRIGKAVARRASAFDMTIAYHGRHEQPGQPHRYYASLEKLAADVNILVVLVPETPETVGLIGPDVLDALGGSGILINVARGSVIDEPALVDALVNGRLGGAGLDVFTEEPKVPAELHRLDSVVLMPHIGSATLETRAEMASLVVANIRALFGNQPLLTPVAQ